MSQTAPAGARVAHRLEVFVGKASRTRSIPKPGLPNLPVYSLLVISRRLSPFYLGEKDGACYALPVLVVTTHCRPLLIPGRPDQLQRRIGNEKRPSTPESSPRGDPVDGKPTFQAESRSGIATVPQAATCNEASQAARSAAAVFLTRQEEHRALPCARIPW